MAQAMQPLVVDSQAARSVQQGPIDGLPILHWFAETGDMHRRFAHGVFLRVPAELQPQQLRDALEQLRTAHPALGARIRDGQLVVETAAAGELMQVNTVSGELELAAEQAFDAALDLLDPAAGAMMQAILLQRDEQSLGLVLAIHHLVVDGVSWRILLDELRQVADGAMQGSRSRCRRKKLRSMSGLHAYEPTSNAAKPSCRSGGRCWRTTCRVWAGARWIRRPIASPR